MVTKHHRANSDHAPTVHADHRVATAPQSATCHRNKTMADTNAVLVVHDQKADSNHRETSTAATTPAQARTQLELAALAADSDQEVHQAAMALVPDPDSEAALVDLVVLALMAALAAVHSDLDLIVAHEIAAVLIKPRERRSLKTHHHHQTSFLIYLDVTF